jgi:serine-type D-Ala-D-Ala endopeptidase (penicillin-binding protein 7)
MRYLILFLALVTGSVHAEPSVFVLNQSKHTAVINQNTDQVRPIASITKLMTALVAIESGLSLESRTQLINRWSTVLPKRSYTRLELLTAMLVRSDNSAAESLAHDYPGGRAAFITAMNAKASQLGMTHTRFEDASGLSKNNVSTAQDLVNLLEQVHRIAVIKDISTRTNSSVVMENKKKPSIVSFDNTNKPVLTEFKNVQISKTGLTTPAGWCVSMVVEEKGQTHYIVVLGYQTKQARLDKVKDIMYNHIIGKLN